MILLLHSLVTPALAATGCAPEDVQSAVQEGLLAFASMDDAGVADAVVAVDAKVACQAAPLPAGTVAQVHQIHGLAAFLDGDAVGAKAAFSAELALEPQSVLPVTIAPEGGKLARLYAESAVPAGEKADMNLSADYLGYVDGVQASKRPRTDPPSSSSPRTTS